MNFREFFTHRGTYLNSASVSPMPKVTILEINRYLRERCTEGSRLELKWFREIEDLRRLVSKLIGADPEEVALVKSTTHGIQLVAQGFPWKEGDEVLVVKGEFPANIYPWLTLERRGVRVKFVEPSDGRVGIPEVERALTDNTRLLAISLVDYLTGHRRDLTEITSFLHQRGIYVSVDAIQGIGVIPFNVKETNVDFLSSGGTKWLLSPMGTGIFYVKKELLDVLELPLLGWRGVRNFLNFSNYDPTPREDARRFEGDTYNLAGLMGFRASLRLILDIGVDEIWQRVKGLTDILIDGLLSMEGCEILTPINERAGIVTFRLKGVDSQRIWEILNEKLITISLREGWLRVSPHFYNDEKDIEKLLEELKRVSQSM
jgi:selenocysteine lyase/cysteine desulfurase